jgi:hypothetical protein
VETTEATVSDIETPDTTPTTATSTTLGLGETVISLTVDAGTVDSADDDFTNIKQDLADRYIETLSAAGVDVEDVEVIITRDADSPEVLNVEVKVVSRGDPEETNVDLIVRADTEEFVSETQSAMKESKIGVGDDNNNLILPLIIAAVVAVLIVLLALLLCLCCKKTIIHVEMPDGQTLHFKINLTASILDLKKKIRDRTSIEPEKQTLLFSGRHRKPKMSKHIVETTLEDHSTLMLSGLER